MESDYQDWDELVRLCSAQVQKNPYDKQAWLLLATGYNNLYMPEEAMQAVQFSLSIDDNFADAHLLCGMIYKNSEMYDKAVVSFLRALDNGCDRPSFARVCVADCYFYQKKWKLAAEMYQHALVDGNAVNIDMFSYRYNMAVSMFRTHLQVEAFDFIDGIREKEPAFDHDGLLIEFALFLEMDNYEEAYRLVDKMEPLTAVDIFFIADTLRDFFWLDKAIEFYSKLGEEDQDIYLYLKLAITALLKDDHSMLSYYFEYLKKDFVMNDIIKLSKDIVDVYLSSESSLHLPIALDTRKRINKLI